MAYYKHEHMKSYVIITWDLNTDSFFASAYILQISHSLNHL